MDPSTTEMMKDYLSVQKTRMTVEKSHDITASRTQKQKPGDHCCRCQSQAEAQQEAIEVPHRPWQLWHFISESGGMIATNAEAIWIWLTGHVAVREASSMACSDFSFKKKRQPRCHSGGHRCRWGRSPWFPPNSEKSDPALGSPWNALPVYRLLSPARGSLLCPKEYLGIDLQSNSKTGVHLHQSTKNKFGNKTNYFSTNTEYTESLKTLNTGQHDH